MSVALLVKRTDGRAISLAEWQQIVGRDLDLRLRTEPYTMRNPKTGETIKLSIGEPGAEIRVGGRWLPFLYFVKGRLTTRHHATLDNPQDLQRIKIAAVAKLLGAVITTDADDRILPW